MGIITIAVYGMLPSLFAAMAKRYTAFNLQFLVLSKLKNEDSKYWAQKYFSAGDYLVTKAESLVKSSNDQQKKIAKKD